MRVPNGVHRDRLSLILAVLSKHTSVKPFAVNVHTNVVGGMTMRCGFVAPLSAHGAQSLLRLSYVCLLPNGDATWRHPGHSRVKQNTAAAITDVHQLLPCCSNGLLSLNLLPPPLYSPG